MKEKETKRLMKAMAKNNKLPKLQKRLYELFYLILVNEAIDMKELLVFLLVEVCQLLSYPFDSKYAFVWKENGLFSAVRNFFYYSRIVPLINGNTMLYYIMFYVNVLALVIVWGLTVFVMGGNAQKRIKRIGIIMAIRKVLFAYNTLMFIPIIDLLVSIFIFDKETSMNKYGGISGGMTGIYYVHVIISAIALVLFIIMTWITTLLNYERRQGVNTAISKLTSKGDIVFYLVKVITLVLFALEEELGYDPSSWVLPSFMVLSGLFLLFNYAFLRPYQNEFIMKAHMCIIAIYTWATCVLFIGRVINTSQYNGSMQLFLVGIPLIIIITFFINHNTIFNTTKSTNPLVKKVPFVNERSAFRYIVDFINIIDSRTRERRVYSILSEYASIHEDNCTINDCPLKKYLILSKEDINLFKEDIEADSNAKIYYLLQHIDQLYHEAINKYPLSIMIRTSYALFLSEKMNKREHSLQVLVKLERYQLSFTERFIVFRLKKLNEEYAQIESLTEANCGNSSCNTNSNDTQENNSMDISTQLSYQFHYEELNYYILKVARIYLSFWTLLMNRTQSVHEDIVKLSNYGYEINDKLEDVKNHFAKLQEIKRNDYTTLLIYSNFLKDILNDEKEGKFFGDLIQEIEESEMTFEDNEIESINIASLSLCSDFHYIVASGIDESLGIMQNVSLGICGLFGYSYNEIIGKQCEILLPDFMQRQHSMLLHKKSETAYSQDTSDKTKKKKNGNRLKEVHSFGKTKSKYLIPLCLKVTFVLNEKNELNLFAKIIPEYNASPTTCYVLTNTNLSIQSFTPNALKILGMNTKAFNGSIDITQLIKEFCEEFLMLCTDNTAVDKQQLKMKILKERYLDNMTMITWKRNSTIPSVNTNANVNMNNNDASPTNAVNHSHPHQINTSPYVNEHPRYKNSSNSSIFAFIEEASMLLVTEIIINNEIVGYSFKFENTNNELCKKSLYLSNTIKPNLDNVSPSLSFRKNSVQPPLSPNGKKAIGNSFKEEMSSFTSNVSNMNAVTSTNAVNALVINPSFLPENKQLIFDPSNLSYIINKTPNETMKEYIQREVYDKMKTKESNSSVSSNEDNEEEYTSSLQPVSSEDNSNEDQSSSSAKEAAHHHVIEMIPNKSSIKNTDSNFIGIGDSERYYKVNLQKIKLSIYDFKKKTTIEIAEYRKVSQVETRKIESDKEKMSSMVKDIQPEKKNQRQGSKATGNDLAKGTKKLANEIESSLNKLNHQISFFKLRFYSFLVILLEAMTIAAYAIVFYNAFGINKSINTALSAGYSFLNTITRVNYFAIEYNLLHIPQYVNYYQDRDVYQSEVKARLMGYYNHTDSIMNNILSSNLPLSTERLMQIAQMQLNVQVGTQQFQMTRYNMTVLPALFEYISALYSCSSLTDKTKIGFYDMDYIYIIMNSDNATYPGLVAMLQLASDEEKDANNVMLYVIITELVILILVEILTFKVLMMVYSVIEKRKEWYLKIFFDIGEALISKLISTCEHFITKTQSKQLADEINLSMSNDNDLRTIGASGSNSQGHYNSNGGNGSNKNKKEDQWLNKKEKTIIMMTLGSYFGTIFLLLLVFSLLYLSFTQTIRISGDIYKRVAFFESYYLKILHCIRSYTLLTPTVLKPLGSFFKNQASALLNNVYKEKDEFWGTLAQYKTDGFLVDNSSALYEDIFITDLCRFLNVGLEGNLSSSTLTCESFADNITSYGLDMIITYYTMYMNEYFKKAEETLQLADDMGVIPNIYAVFNDNIARDCNIIWQYMLIPAFDEWRTGFYNSIMNEYNVFELISILFIIAMEIVNWCLYFFYVIPKQTFLMTGLQKTKNMLHIIPKDVLYQILLQEY